MNRFIIFALLALSTGKISAQTIVSAANAAKHIGETVKVIDQVYSDNLNGNERILSVGGSAAKPSLQVIISSSNFGITEPQDKAIYQGHHIAVTGKLIRSHGNPAIMVAKPSQLKMVMMDMDKRKPIN